MLIQEFIWQAIQNKEGLMMVDEKESNFRTLRFDYNFLFWVHWWNLEDFYKVNTVSFEFMSTLITQDILFSFYWITFNLQSRRKALNLFLQSCSQGTLKHLFSFSCPNCVSSQSFSFHPDCVLTLRLTEEPYVTCEASGVKH